MNVLVYDTTLRDGTQGEGVSFTCQDKLRVARLLDDFGVAYIEGGWPGSNPKDAEFFARAKTMRWKHARLAAFGATCRVNSQPEDDANLRALLAAETPVVTVVGKTWTLHVTNVLQTTLDENLRLIRASVAYLKAHGREVIYDAEHFFDGYCADAAYALATLRAGCTLAQGTINGYGERCGNADLCAIIPNLELKMGMTCLPPGHLAELTRLARTIAEIANLATDNRQAYVGRSAFLHKGGLHVAAQRRNGHSYQHIDPARVGNETRIAVSELAGRGNLLSKVEELGLAVDVSSMANVLQRIKELEARGFHFESADASVELMLRRAQPDYQPLFEMLDFMAVVEHRAGRGIFAEANIKLRVNGEIVHTAAEGNGPVNALDNALRKALREHYPAIDAFHLADYKVRILDGNAGTAATTRVLIETANHRQTWNTVGASSNIIEASWLALYDAVEYGLAVASEQLDSTTVRQ